jgi:hypothetical protein
MKNVYFSHGTSSEQRLYEDLIIESLKIYGFDVYYLPREVEISDHLFGEDTLVKFDENYMIEMYLSNYEGFAGEGTLLTRFGVRIAEEATFIISKRRWEDLTDNSNNLITNKRPNEGDVIYFPLTNQLFQIKFVEHNKPFRQLGQIATYQLVCEVMEDSSERLDTGVSEIDKIRRSEGYSITFQLSDGIKQINVTNQGNNYIPASTTVGFGSVGQTVIATASATVSAGKVVAITVTNPGLGYTTVPGVAINGAGTGATAQAILVSKGNYLYKETVIGSVSGATAEVVRYDVSTKQLELIDIIGTFVDNDLLIGQSSGAEWAIYSFSSIENQNDDFNENKWFEDEANEIIDWSEKNPFGEYSNMGDF